MPVAKHSVWNVKSGTILLDAVGGTGEAETITQAFKQEIDVISYIHASGRTLSNQS